MEADKTLDELLEPFYRWLNEMPIEKAYQLTQKHLNSARQAREHGNTYGLKAEILSAWKWHRRYRDKLKQAGLVGERF
jgi:hypothetical protein